MILNKSNIKKNEGNKEFQTHASFSGISNLVKSTAGISSAVNYNDNMQQYIDSELPSQNISQRIAKQFDSKKSQNQSSPQQLLQHSIIEELLLNDKGEKIVYKMRPSKIIQQKCYRIVDLRQQRIKVLPFSSKENTNNESIPYQHNPHHQKNQKNYEKSQASSQIKTPQQTTQGLQNVERRGTCLTGISTNVSNVTPAAGGGSLLGNSMLTQNEFDGRNLHQSIFSFQVDNCQPEAEAGVTASRNQFIFSEKHTKNFGSKRLSISREKYRIKAKGNQAAQTSNNFYNQQQQGIYHQSNDNYQQKSQVLNTKASSNNINNNQNNNNNQKSTILGSAYQDCQFPTYQMKNHSQTQIESTRLITKNDNFNNDDASKSKIHMNNRIPSQEDDHDSTAATYLRTCSSNLKPNKIDYTSNFQSVGKQSASSCTQRADLQTRHYKSTTAQGFYPNYQDKNKSENITVQQNLVEQVSNLNDTHGLSFSKLNQSSKLKNSQLESLNPIHKIQDPSKSVIFQQLSNVIHFNPNTKKLFQNGLTMEQMASQQNKSSRLQLKSDLSSSNPQRQTYKDERNTQYEKNLKDFIEGKDLSSQKLQNKSYTLRGCTSESIGTHRKVSSNVVTLPNYNSNQAKTVLEDSSSQNNHYNSYNNNNSNTNNNSNLFVLNLSSRPLTASNLLEQNKIFRDEDLNKNLQKKIRKIKIIQNSDYHKPKNEINICQDYESTSFQQISFKRENNEFNQKQANSSNGNELLMVLQNQQCVSEEVKQQQLQSKLSNQRRMKKSSLQNLPAGHTASASIPNQSQLQEIQQLNGDSQKKQIDSLIGQMFKNSFFPSDRFSKNSNQNPNQLLRDQLTKRNTINNVQFSNQLSYLSQQRSGVQDCDLNKQILINNLKRTQPTQQQYNNNNDSSPENESDGNVNQVVESEQNINNSEKDIDQIEQKSLEKQILTEEQLCDSQQDINNDNYEDEYHQLNQYYHQKYTNFSEAPPTVKRKQYRSQKSNNQNKQDHQQNFITDIEFYDKFEPWEIDDQAPNMMFEEEDDQDL